MTKPVVPSVPSLRRKSRMCFSGLDGQDKPRARIVIHQGGQRKRRERQAGRANVLRTQQALSTQQAQHCRNTKVAKILTRQEANALVDGVVLPPAAHLDAHATPLNVALQTDLVLLVARQRAHQLLREDHVPVLEHGVGVLLGVLDLRSEGLRHGDLLCGECWVRWSLGNAGGNCVVRKSRRWRE